jgi:tetratricopeptide (TPR) repeat protein
MSGDDVDIATAKTGRDDPCERLVQAPGSNLSSETKQKLCALFLEAEKRWIAARWTEAIPLVLEITRLDPLSPQAHRDLGVTYLYCARFSEAAASLQRAVDLRPNDEDALIHLVEALEHQGREPEAMVACRKLGEIAQYDADRYFFAAKALLKAGRSEDAERELRRLPTPAPKRTRSWRKIGTLLSDLGKFEAAEPLLVEAIDETPGAFESLADIKRMTEDDRPLLDRMEAALDQPNLPALTRTAIHFGLGKSYDDLGDYRRAMEHYDAGNGLRAVCVRLDRKAYAAKVDRA